MDQQPPVKKKRFGPKKAYLHRLQSNNSNDEEDSCDSPQPLSELGTPRRQHVDSFSGISLPDDLRLSFSEIDDGSLQLDDLDFSCSPSVGDASSLANQEPREDVPDKVLTKMTSVISSTLESTSTSSLTQNVNLNSNYSSAMSEDLNNGFFHSMTKSSSISSNGERRNKVMDYFPMKSETSQDGMSRLTWSSESSWDLPNTSQDPQVSTVGSSGDGLIKKPIKARRTSKNKHLLNMPCQVCGDMAAGFYCGAYICEACKKFYMRAFKQDKLKYVCLREKQCTITKESRVQCQYCRFQKCVQLNMYCPKQGESETSKDMPMSEIPCRVCSAPSSGFHFGAITCEGCKGFFRRMAKEREPEKYQCNKKGLCEINMITRNLCKACRYQQCLNAGMSVEGSRIGRQPNSVKHAITMELKHNVKVETQPSDNSETLTPLSTPPLTVKVEPLDYSDIILDTNNKPVIDNTGDMLMWDEWSNCDGEPGIAADDQSEAAKSSQSEVNNSPEISPIQQAPLPQPSFLFKSAHKQNQLMALQQVTSPPPWLPKPSPLMGWSGQDSLAKSTIWSSINTPSCASSSSSASSHSMSSRMSTTIPSTTSSLSQPVFMQMSSVQIPSTSQQSSASSSVPQSSHPAQSPQVSPKHFSPTFTPTVTVSSMPQYTTPAPSMYDSQVTQKASWSTPSVVSPSSKELQYSTTSWQQSQPNLHSPKTPTLKSPKGPSNDDTRSAVLPGPKIKIQVPSTDLSSMLPEAMKRQNGGVSNSAYTEKMQEFIQKIAEAGKVLQLLNYRVFDSDLSPTPSMNVDEIKAQFQSKYMDPRAGNNIISKADMSMFSTRESTWNYMMTNFHHNTYITIRFAKMVPGFKTLTLNDQEKLIKSSIYPIELLNMSKVFDPVTKRYNYFTYTLDEEKVMMEQFPMLRVFQEHFLHVGTMVTSFGFDDEEFALLSALLLFPAEIPGLENPGAVEDLQNEISCALQYYEEKHFSDGLTRYGVLLVRVAELVQCLLQHNLAIGLLLNNNPTIKVPQLFHELIIESIKEGQPK